MHKIINIDKFMKISTFVKFSKNIAKLLILNIFVKFYLIKFYFLRKNISNKINCAKGLVCLTDEYTDGGQADIHETFTSDSVPKDDDQNRYSRSWVGRSRSYKDDLYP